MTSIEWLVEEIKNSKYYFKLMAEINSRGTILQPNIFEKAKEMHKQEMATNCSKLEISDEEIEKEIKSRYETPHYNSGFMDCAKWYREQLKQL